MQELQGRTITRIRVAKNGWYLVFSTDKGRVAYKTWGDCCSETWFADIVGVVALLGGRVNSVQEMEMAEPNDNRSRQQYDTIYGYKITTDKGHCDIVFRNSSNGYYGGSIEYLEKPEIAKMDLVEVKEDWNG